MLDLGAIKNGRICLPLSIQEAGYLPEAVVNFVAFLGWGHVSGKEMYTMDELIKEVIFVGRRAWDKKLTHAPSLT